MPSSGSGVDIEEENSFEGAGKTKAHIFLPPKLHRQASKLLSNPLGEAVALPFQKLKQLCRFEKGGYCKKIKRKCEAQKCPQIPKGE
jgi:hypothetical protein